MNSSLPSQPDFRPPVCYGSLKLASRYLLSPLAGYTNLPFRRIVREIGGVGLATTDLVNARGLLEGSAKTLQLIQTCPEDTPFAVQIFGNDPKQMQEAAQLLQDRDVDSIDINMGCPVNRIVKGGAGASMMCHPDKTIALVQSVVESVKIPVSVKMRLGWDDHNLSAPFFAREFEQVGVVAVAIHGRTREQGFRGSVNHDGIRQVVEAVQSIPVIGNGDVTSIADADYMLKTTGCAGVSIGRGALANPWIFHQLVQWEQTGQCDPPGKFDDRLELLLRQFRYLLEMTTEHRAISMFRKMGHWYLKSMRVMPALRHQFQCAQNLKEFEEAINTISAKGPRSGSRNGILPDMHIPVPGGAVERW
ncbi:MAG: tRNA dihydrouridine synthase DusB [Planctomycetes bacterium]|nr:tRNA dihydrouridine synthase DusB [Planctomycetota bacterium]MCH9726431.1 tRNA dihydrouridine synthase DusB [Planctomycetota bacterium]MCH9778240.1 tRNA dihydrouridine synthase DusB [Planctomycetota bacterium]MCH9790713.1 tRNA dihydrouridine synthase DusB [Planctomycetota bacterium]